MQANDIMTDQVITVSPETSVTEVAELLLKKGISAVPVEDADGRITGMISEADLMHRAEIGPEARVRDVMHEGVLSVPPETDLLTIVAIMEKHRVKRVLVMEDGRLGGILARSDLLRGFLAGQASAQATQSDRAIRSTILEELGHQLGTQVSSNNVLVVDGVVSFWGHVSSEEERRVLRAAAETIAGVKRVEDHMVLLPGGPVY